LKHVAQSPQPPIDALGSAARAARARSAGALIASIAALVASPAAHAVITCTQTITANVVALDQPLMFNRLGAQNVNGMVFALRRDVIDEVSGKPLTAAGVIATPGKVALRPDKRPRPLVLRVPAGACLRVSFQNLLAPQPNPNDAPHPDLFIDAQTADRYAGFQVMGMQLVNDINDDASMVGNNHLAPGADPSAGSLVPPGGSRIYTLYAEREGTFLAQSYGSTFGSEGTQGNSANGLFGAVNVEPVGARAYRSKLHEEEFRIARRAGTTTLGQPIINYNARYPSDCASATVPTDGVWCREGKAGLPIVNIYANTAAGGAPRNASEIVHADIDAIIAGPNADGTFPPSTYPLERVGKRNPSVPNRLEPFREFTVLFHDEVAAAQAFPAWYDPTRDPVFAYVLQGVRDAFMINYGSGGIGSEIIANRLGVGPMHDCLNCAYEEFFLTSFTVGDPAQLVDIPANVGLEACTPRGQNCEAVGPKAKLGLFPDDPANIHHSYTNDFVKFRNLHVGKEQHVFHLHNHQWLFNSNDDNSNYVDAQGIGPGQGYTYEIAFGGSGNRNKTAGDAIFHCHFYPHFAQGMWEHWRVHDVFEAGTRLKASGTGRHTLPWALRDGTPNANARALPDGEVVAGMPIPALVPLPGKPMPVMPGQVKVVPKVVNGLTMGSVAQVVDRTKNPGYPFWIAGIEQTVGQRPPTPPLDMATAAQVTALKAGGNPLWTNLDPAQADGWDGGLPRHTLEGVRAAGHTPAAPAFESTVNRLDFSKEILRARPVWYAEEGTDIEQLAMAFHAVRNHPSFAVNVDGTTVAGNFVTNGGGGPVIGAPYHEPCIDDNGQRLNAGVIGQFFSGETLTAKSITGSSVFNAQTPRIIKAAVIQLDAVFNKIGYHYPQQRIETMLQDAIPTIDKLHPPEPYVMRMNTFDCAVFTHTNLVPYYYELDDYQVRTPTDIIGQHIHLPKWDLTTADGAGNGWNYEDGTLAPGAVRERIRAIRAFNACAGAETGDARDGTPTCPTPKRHPFFGNPANDPLDRGACPAGSFCGARTTIQRWFADPVVNSQGVHRGLGIIFTHDHYGPSTHQQIGLYSTLLIEPAASQWVHNETGRQLGCNFPGDVGCRADGGPTSWQAAILTGDVDGDGRNDSYREFYFEFSDFQHAYEAGVYVGADARGAPLEAEVVIDANGDAQAPGLVNTFRRAINPPTRLQVEPVFPDLVIEAAANPASGCPRRPCPQAISVEDPGMHVVNYRNEPVGLRVYDPAKLGPDGKPGAQADGRAGDLAFALQSRIDRKIAQFNTIGGDTPYPLAPSALALNRDVDRGDPFTPMVRAYSGDTIRIKMQAGGHEEEHNATIHGVKWLQGGSGYGRSPNSGWRNGQAAGISEQFTLASPIIADLQQRGNTADYAYSMDASNDGWWSGMWGLTRIYDRLRGDLYALPSNPRPVKIGNPQDFNGVCPKTAPIRRFDVTAVLANAVLPAVKGVSIVPAGPAATQHVGGPLDPNGGTLIYNPRDTAIPLTTIPADAPGEPPITIGGHAGPLHDPTSILYVRTRDLDPLTGKLRPGVPVEPLVLRAAAGDCIQVTLRNALPRRAPDLASYTTLQGVVKRDRDDPQGSTTFNMNLIRPSANVGLHAQLLEYDITRGDGTNVGSNRTQTVPPGGARTYRWYAGDLSLAGAVLPLDATTLTAITTASTTSSTTLVSETTTTIQATPVVLDSADNATSTTTTTLETTSTAAEPSTDAVLAIAVLPAPLSVAPSDTTLVLADPELAAAADPAVLLAADPGVVANQVPALALSSVTTNKASLVATPVEFGALNLAPADKVKQGSKGLVGAMVVEPQGATWIDDADSATAAKKTRTSATVTPAGVGAVAFRDFSVVLQKGLTQRYADGAPIEHLNGEGLGIPEDSQDSSHMGINYRVEPLWFRFAKAPNAPFGHAAGAGFGDVANAHQAYSNVLTAGADPATPVFFAEAGKPFRMRVTNPHGTSRGSTMQLHGHLWPRIPYLAQNVDANGFPIGSGGVGSVRLGNNPVTDYTGAQESVTPYSHWNWVFGSSGGLGAIRGDFLFRDQGGFGNTGGLWGIVRVR
jgi:hypothetical protein